MAIKNEQTKRAGAETVRRTAGAQPRVAAQVKATPNSRPAFAADELSSGRGGALRANATRLLGASGLSSTVKVDAPPPAPTQTYVVQSGDTLTSIATRFNTTVPALQQLNGLANPDSIMVGQKLTVPGAAAPPPPADSWQGRYTVQPGDTLTAIASRCGTTVAELQAHNGITDPNTVWVGTTLAVPGPASGAPATGPQASAVPASTALGSTVAQLAGAEQAAWAGDPSGAKYWQYGSGNPEAWCADFVSTVFGKANAPLGTKGVGFSSVPSMVAWFSEGATAADPHARTFLPGTGTPQVGDVVVFDWNKDGSADHTGIVTAVRADGSFDTIEGNTNGSGESNGEVASHTYTSRDQVMGFGRLQVTPTTRTYTVEAGDSGLWNLSVKLGVNYHALLQANPGISSLAPGQTLVVPTLENTPPQAPPSSEPPQRPPFFPHGRLRMV